MSIKKSLKSIKDMPEMSFEQIGAIMGISRQRVEQIEKSALKKLKRPELINQWNDILETYAELTKPKCHENNSTRRKGTIGYNIDDNPSWAFINVGQKK